MHGMSELIIDTYGTAKFKLCWKLEIFGGHVDRKAITLASSESSLSSSVAQLASYIVFRKDSEENQSF